MENLVSFFRSTLNVVASVALVACLAIVWSGRETQEPVAPSPVEPVYEVETMRKALVASHLAAKYRQPKEAVAAYVDLAWREAAKHPDVEPELILAVIQKESSLRPMAESSYGAQGLMQVVPRWHPEKLAQRESLFDPRVNIRVGAQILQEYLWATGGVLEAALARYSGDARDYASFVVRETKALKAIRVR